MAYKPPSWDEAPAIGKPKKKRKRQVGPTNEAAKLGLAGPNEYTTAPVTPDRPQPTSQLQVTPGTTLSPGGVLAAGQIAMTGDQALSETLEEMQVRNINLAYFEYRHELAPPDVVLSMLTNQATNQLSYEQYLDLFKGVDTVGQYEPKPIEQMAPPKDEFFAPQTNYTGPVPLPGSPLGGGRYGAPKTERGPVPMGGNITKNQAQQDMRRLMHATAGKSASTTDMAGEAFPDTDLVSFSRMVAQRSLARGRPVEWDVDHPQNDPDFLRAAGVYAMGRQIAYAALGNDKDQEQANQTIEYLRSLPFSSNQWEEIGRKLGVGVADWSNGKTFPLVLEAMRSSDSELVHEILYDGWQFGRPQSQSPSQSMHDYATKFGLDRLPAKARQEWAQSSNSLSGMVSAVMSEPGKLWKKVEEVPGLGAVAAPIGWAAGQSQKWLFAKPLEEVSHSLAFIYKMIGGEESPKVAKTGEQKSKTIIGLLTLGNPLTMLWVGRNEGDEELTDDEQYHLNTLLDGSRWAAEWEETKGRNPFTMYMEDYSRQNFGYVKPWAADVGDGMNIGFQFGLAARLDPAYRFGAVKAGQAAFKGARFTEAAVRAYVTDARLRYGAAESGEWILRIKKSDLDILAPAERERYHALRDEYRTLESDLQSQARGDLAAETGSASPDIAMDYKSVKEYILARNGVTRGSTARGTESDLHGLVKPENARGGKPKKPENAPKPLDEVIDEMVTDNPGLPFTDVNSFWDWMDAQKSAPKSKAKTTSRAVVSPMERMDAIEAEVAEMLSRDRENLMDAPTRMFEADELIGEGQQAGLDIAVDATARKTEPFAAPPERGPEQMPGQTSMTAAPQYHGSSAGPITKIEPNKVSTSLGGFDTTNSPEAANVYSQSKAKGATPAVTEFEGVPEKPMNLDLPPDKHAWEQVAARNPEIGQKQLADILAQPDGRGAFAKASDILGEGGEAKIKAVLEDELGYDAFTYTEHGGWQGGPGTHVVTSWTKAAIEKGTVRIKGETPFKIGDEVRVAQPTDFGAGIGNEKTGRITEIETLPDGTAEYKVEGLDQPWVKAEDIIGPERRTVPRETPVREAPPVETNAQGVKVSPVETATEGAQMVDASTAEWNQRLNDGGYPTHQSHGLPEDHPAGHPARKAEPYVEFLNRDLKVEGKAATKLGLIRQAAKKVGATVTRGKAVVDGKERSTTIVHGDVGGFVDELMGPPGPPPVTLAAESAAASNARMLNVWFRTKAEVFAVVDDPVTVGTLLKVPENNAVAKMLVEQIATEKDWSKVAPMLEELRTKHGIDVDAFGSAMVDNMRQAAFRNGFGKRNWLRFFTTPTLYGKTQPIENSTESVFAYMVASKMGAKHKMSPEQWMQVQDLRLEYWRETSGLKKRNIVAKIDDIIEDNIKQWDSDLEGLTGYTKWYRIAQGRSIMSGVRRAYYGAWEVVDGEMRPKERSRVTSRPTAKAVAQRALDGAKADLEGITKGASPASRARLEAAVTQAENEVLAVADACDIVERLGVAKDLSKADLKRLNKAHETLSSYGGPVPVKMGQAANKISFRHDPRILSAYVTGPVGRDLAIVDQAVFQPLMTIFKETVMSTLGFPIRVNIGDEFIRLIPEGTLKRLGVDVFTAHPLEKLLKDPTVKSLFGDELEAMIRDKLAYDWVASDSGDWILVTKQTHPKYYDYYAADLRSWANEPIVKKLVEEHDGVFPSDVGDVSEFIRGILAEDSETGSQLRNFLEDTYRSDGGALDPANFTEWAGLWQDRMEAISRNRTLREAMTRRVSPDELKANVPDELLWPVNAPEQLFIGANKNPLVQLSRVNPFHYVYNGIPVPFGGGRRYGSLQLLGTMSNWLRETIFSDRYYRERDLELARAPELAKTAEGLAELHQNAAKKALSYTNSVTYSRSATMFEDMARNLIPFVNAYRQFWQYWTATFVKHPFALSVWMKNYSQLEQDVAGVAGGISEEVGGPDISMNGQFLAIGDYQAFMPAIPFLAVSDENAPEGLAGVALSNLPQASFLVSGGARTLMGAMGMESDEIEKFSTLPFMGGLSTSFAPFSRQAKLLYGVSGWTVGNNDTLEALFGDPDKLRKASINAIIGQMRYVDGQGPVRDKPWWWLGIGKHPEALFAEAMKWLPNPSTVSYSPAETRNKAQWLYEYYKAQGSGKTVDAAKVRSEHPWLDTYLSYYDASEDEKLEMKLDPKNKEMLKWWVSPYNYDQSGAPLEGTSWQDQFTKGRISYKDESEYENAIHNLYVDVWGGTYKQSAYRTGGTSYKGDAARDEARRVTMNKMRHALQWAKDFSAHAAKERGWDAEQLMWWFQNPEKNFGIWPQVLQLNGMDPAQYNVFLLAKTFFSGYGNYYPRSKTPQEAVKEAKYGKLQPQPMGMPDVLRALELDKYIIDPKLAKRFLTETPYADDVKLGRKEQTAMITSKIIEAAASEQWYQIGSQQLKLIGVDASPQLDLIQADLHADYLALKQYKVGSSEYKSARNAYYAERKKRLSAVKGGELLVGGLADRLRALPFVLDANVTSMGTGPTAHVKQANYDVFLATVKKELAKGDPDPEKLNEAWDGVRWSRYKERQQTEAKRAAAWAYLIAEGKHRRNLLMQHYSDYYKAPGESAASKFGTYHVDQLNKVITGLRKFSPEFSAELDRWFGSDRNVGYALLDWYNM